MSDAQKTSPANIFAILAFALLFVVAIWSGIQIVKFAPRAIGDLGLFSSLKGEPSVSMYLDKAEINPGEELNISWKLEGNVKDGTVSFIYKCEEGIVLDIYDDLSKSYKTLPCNTPYNMPLSSKSLKIRAQSGGRAMQELVLAIVYTNAEGEKYKDIEKITLKNSNVAADSLEPDTSADGGEENEEELASNNPDTNNNSSSNTASSGKEGTISNETRSPRANTQANKCESKIYGKPDLAVHNLRVGVETPSGNFISKTSFSSSDVITVKFTVSNNGNRTSPAWYFQALLPKLDGQLYSSQAQAAIPPCSGRYYTLRIYNPKKGYSSILISIDPQNLINELNEINNNASKEITVY